MQIEVGGRIHHLGDRESPEVSSSWEFSILSSQVSNAVDQLRQKGADASWIVLMFYTAIPSVETDDNCINLQFSIQDGVLGLEWVLLGERNTVDMQPVTSFIKDKGHTAAVQEMNGVSFLRVEDGDLVALSTSIAKELYQVPPTYQLGLLAEGFKYEPPAERMDGNVH